MQHQAGRHFLQIPGPTNTQLPSRNGLGPLADQVFRIGHLGDFNTLSVTGTLSGIEMGLKARGIPHRKGGVVEAAIDVLAGNSPPVAQAAE